VLERVVNSIGPGIGPSSDAHWHPQCGFEVRGPGTLSLICPPTSGFRSTAGALSGSRGQVRSASGPRAPATRTWVSRVLSRTPGLDSMRAQVTRVGSGQARFSYRGSLHNLAGASPRPTRRWTSPAALIAVDRTRSGRRGRLQVILSSGLIESLIHRVAAWTRRPRRQGPTH
jgi:hypothetical protein